MVKVVTGNEVLVVTGVGATKKIVKTIEVKDAEGNVTTEERVTYQPKVRIAGASIVIPLIQRSRRFDICVEKAEQANDTMKTQTGVEIVLDWGISYAPNADSVESLLPCIRQFLDKQKDEIQDIIKSAVAGGMRAVISTMTPQEVMVGKETLDDLVQKNISVQMAELGYKVQIYIQEVRDAANSTYYRDLAAKDRETLKRDAANITAEANQEVRAKAAEAERIAKEAELSSQVIIAEREKEAAVQKATFKTDRDRAEADANVAGKLRAAERECEVVEKNGQVEVMRQEQANLAAIKAQTVAVTEAETEKRKAVIATETDAEQRKINANAAAEVNVREAQGRADAAKADASGMADAKKIQAAADAEAIRMAAEAEATKTRVTGQAEADAISAKGKAEAEAIEAKGRAEAEAEKALSDARAANNSVNFELSKVELMCNAQVQVATKMASVMAEVGRTATFYDFGGNSQGQGGNLLTRVMGEMPTLMKKANLASEALNGESFDETISSLSKAIFGGLRAETPSQSVPEQKLPLNEDIPTDETEPSTELENDEADAPIADETAMPEEEVTLPEDMIAED